MSLELTKNKSIILKAFEDLLSEKTSTDWMLLGYEGLTNVLKFVESGDGGIEEMAEDLNASKIMYAVIKVCDPKTSRNKIVLINWQGEGAPNLRKGACARHIPDVKRLLKGVHITINARNEDEVEPLVVMEAVTKATATEYNFKDRSEMPEKNSPVGTNYKRTNPLKEVNSNTRNKFWEEQEAEEKRRKEEEIKRKEEDAKKLEKERLEREVKEAKHREDLNKDRNLRITATKKAEKAADISKPNQEWAQQMQEHEKEEVQRARRADQMRMQRKKEAESLIGHKTLQTRSMFESCPVASVNTPVNKAPKKVLKQSFVTDEKHSPPKEEPTSLPKKKVSGRWPPPSDDQDASVPAVPGKIAEWKPKSEDPSQSKTQEPIIPASNTLYQSAVSPKIESSVMLPSNGHANGHSNNNSPIEEVPLVQDSVSLSPENHSSEPTSPTYETPPPGKHIICEIDGVDYQILPEHGICARALFDYQAADDSEITFDPGDIITNIEQIDVGWWQGVGPSATFGLFPANYVELITESEN